MSMLAGKPGLPMRRLALLSMVFFMAMPHAAAEPETPAWFSQQAKTARYSFAVQARALEDERYELTALRVLDRKTGLVQQELALDAESNAAGEPAAWLRLLDANGDGWPDLSLPRVDGGPGPNFMRSFFLFEPRSGQFRLHAGLAALSQPGFHKHGVISAELRSSCCSFREERYRFVGGQLQLVAELNTELVDGEMLSQGRQLVKGRWQAIKRLPKLPVTSRP